MLTRGVSELTDEFRGVLLLEVIVDILSVFITLTLLNVGWVIAKSVAEKQVPWIARVAEATNFQQIVLNILFLLNSLLFVTISSIGLLRLLRGRRNKCSSLSLSLKDRFLRLVNWET